MNLRSFAEDDPNAAIDADAELDQERGDERDTDQHSWRS